MSGRAAIASVAAAACLLLGACSPDAPASSRAPATASDRLPAATLPGLRSSDRAWDMSTAKGPLVVNLWANYCAPCRHELPIYQQFHERHPSVKVVGVDWEDPARDRAIALARGAKVTYPLVVDLQPTIRSQALPKLILIDGSGRIAWQEYLQITSLRQLEGLVTKHLGVRL